MMRAYEAEWIDTMIARASIRSEVTTTCLARPDAGGWSFFTSNRSFMRFLIG
jgi:hypothetical protein